MMNQSLDNPPLEALILKKNLQYSIVDFVYLLSFWPKLKCMVRDITYTYQITMKRKIDVKEFIVNSLILLQDSIHFLLLLGIL